MSKNIHVAWPILCKVELEDVISKLNVILKRVDNCIADEPVLVMAVRSVISAGKRALVELDEAYGK